MPEDNKQMFRYRIVRYTPNPVRDEWANIGVILENVDGSRRAARIIEDSSEIARVRRVHPDANEEILRNLPGEFESAMRGAPTDLTKYLRNDETLSGAVSLGGFKSSWGDDFDAELDRVYRERVAPPARVRGGLIESTRGWIKARMNDVLRRHRVLRLERSVRVEEFTEPGDPFKLDYAYRNGVRGFLHAVALGRDPVQAKVLAYTAERVRARVPHAEFTAITEVAPSAENRRHAFISRLFEDNRIAIVPLNDIEGFAEQLRRRIVQ
jgi:Protein of unknown function (DUF3037)